ncbi:unnamed protein product [Linum tenue]|uniref:Uncharacterized protein n=1 Tax=Linum tenue TaxID=586396 RepID=A0AAV0NM42_9ROSI|nr:unnamed protein product [Linum tenue]
MQQQGATLKCWPTVRSQRK